jgi:ankyrin repeat protein
MSSTLESLLLKAIETNDIPTVSSLIERGVNVNCIPSPLCRAAEHGHVEIMTMLLDAGADIDKGIQANDSACHVAIRRQHDRALKLLLDRGAKIDASFLKTAATPPKEEIVLLLLDADAPLDNLTNDELMNLVAAQSSVAVLKRLLARNVDVCALKGLHMAVHCVTM